LPQQCSNYKTIADATRLITAPGGTGCDNSSSLFHAYGTGNPTYVRFMSPGGTRLATSPPNSGNGKACGTVETGWTNATYPSVVGQTVNAYIGFAYNGNPSYSYVYWLPITNCNGYYVHGLYSLSFCYFRYCTQP
jgi:hypothetical protein